MRDNDSQKIIVVGIPKTMDDAALSELFSGFGTVAEAKVVLDANNKQPRGFGFVTFTSGAAMRKAIQDMNKKVVEGRTLNVRQLIPKDKFQADKSKDENAPDAASRPCWLLRKGKCTKGDQCPFSHETKNGEFGSCFEFMQTGECKRGDKCIFSHKVAGANKDGDEQEEEETAPETAKPKPESKKPLAAGGAARKEDGGEQKQRVCYAFQKGKCHRGKKCLFLHEKVPEMANDVPVPVVVAKKDGAAPATKRGEFEVVTQADTGKKRSRAEDSHDDDSGDDDEEEAEEKPAAKQQKSAPSKAAAPLKSDGALRGLAAHMSTVIATTKKAKPTPTQASPAKQTPRSEDNSKPSSEKRPRSEDATKPFEKRPRVERDNNSSGYKNKFEQREQRLEQMREHPAAKRIMEREQLKNGPSKYGGYTAPQPPPQPKRKEDVWKARNNKNALQRLNKKNRVPGQQPEQHQQQREDGERPPPKQKREKVDMGAAFDSDDDRKPRSSGGTGGGKKKVVDKVAQKANREKLQLERRAKRDAKKSALSRLQTQEKVEL